MWRMLRLSMQQFRLSCRRNLYPFRKEAFKGALANRWHSASIPRAALEMF